MKQVKNCPICGKIFDSNQYITICPACVQQDERTFDRIREYLFLRPLATVFEVANDLDMPIHFIKRYLREGRLEIRERNNTFLDCEQCGRPITSGHLCSECAAGVKHAFKASYQPATAVGDGKISFNIRR